MKPRTTPRTSRPEGCLSDYALDRHLAAELDAAAASADKAHLAECQRCTARFEELSRERDTFAREAPPLRLPGRPPSVSRPRRPWGGMASGALAFAAAIALFVVFRTPRAEDGTRAKGAAAKLGFYVSHGGSVRPGGPGERLVPGDGLRFVVTTREALYVAVMSVDGLRHASIYYPSTTEAARLDAGGDVALPESTTLDEALGDETIYGVFCRAPFTVEPLRRALEANPDRPPAPEGCTVDLLHVRKEAPTPP